MGGTRAACSNLELTERSIRMHFRKVVSHHVFERRVPGLRQRGTRTQKTELQQDYYEALTSQIWNDIKIDWTIKPSGINIIIYRSVSEERISFRESANKFVFLDVDRYHIRMLNILRN